MSQRPERILDDAGGPLAPRWLPGARAQHRRQLLRCLRLHDRGGHRPRGIGRRRTRSPTASSRRWSTGSLRASPAPASDRAIGIALYMPMTLECVAAYLGVDPGRLLRWCPSPTASPPTRSQRRLEIAGCPRRRSRSTPSSASGKRIALYEKVVEAGAPRTDRHSGRAARSNLREGDLLWAGLPRRRATIPLPSTANPTPVINVLFSSGTTGDPKAIPWTHLTPIKAAMDGHFHQDIGPGTRGRVADQHRLDDGTVADLRHPDQPRRDGALRGRPDRQRLRPTSSSTPGSPCSGWCRPWCGRGERPAPADERRLEPDRGLQLDRRAVHQVRLPVADEPRRLPGAGHRVLRRHRDRRWLHHRHRRPAGVAGHLHHPGARTRPGDARRARPGGRRQRDKPARSSWCRRRSGCPSACSIGTTTRSTTKAVPPGPRRRGPAPPRRPAATACERASTAPTAAPTTP